MPRGRLLAPVAEGTINGRVAKNVAEAMAGQGDPALVTQALKRALTVD